MIYLLEAQSGHGFGGFEDVFEATHVGVADAFGGGDEEVAFVLGVLLGFDPAVFFAPGERALDAGFGHVG